MSSVMAAPGSVAELLLTRDGGGLLFDVRVAPRASRAAIKGVHDGALKVALTAPPVDGAANAALVKLLAKQLGVAKSAVRIVSGERARNKRVRIEGVSADDVAALTPPSGTGTPGDPAP